MNLLHDIRSFCLVMIHKVATIQDVNKSLQDFVPLSGRSMERVKEVAFSIPDTWTYFRFVCFSKTFYKNNYLDFSSWLLCHCLGIINIHRLTGSIVQTKQNTSTGENSRFKIGKRKRIFDLHVRQTLEEMKKKKSLMQRVSMSRGKFGNVVGVIDGGECLPQHRHGWHCW